MLPVTGRVLVRHLVPDQLTVEVGTNKTARWLYGERYGLTALPRKQQQQQRFVFGIWESMSHFCLHVSRFKPVSMRVTEGGC